jgi:hypothetical protein
MEVSKMYREVPSKGNVLFNYSIVSISKINMSTIHRAQLDVCNFTNICMCMYVCVMFLMSNIITHQLDTRTETFSPAFFLKVAFFI